MADQCVLCDDALLREAQVLKLLSISRSTLRRWIAQGIFPAGIRISARITVWRSSVVQAWIRSHASATR